MKRRYCCRCRAHGVLVHPVGHINICPYLSCECYSCERITIRNRNSAKRKYLRRQAKQNTNDLKNVSFSSIEDSHGLDHRSLRSDNTSHTNKCPTCSNVLLHDVVAGPDTGYLRFNDQSTQTYNNILVIIMEDAEVESSTNLTSPPDTVISSRRDVPLNNTYRDLLADNGHFSFNNQSSQTCDNITNMESVKPTSNSTSPIIIIEGNKHDLTYNNTDREAIPDTGHLRNNDQFSQASSITIKTKPTLSSHSISPFKDVLKTRFEDTFEKTDQYSLPDFNHSNPKDRSTQTCENTCNSIITNMESALAITRNFSTSPIADDFKNRYDQEPEHIDQEVLKRFDCIPFSVVLQRLRNPEIYY